MKKTTIGILTSLLLFLFACQKTSEPTKNLAMAEPHKEVIYQVFPRLFGNTNTTNKPWGTIEENGVGTFSDFTPEVLNKIKALGVTYIWYTGVPHHAVIRDYTAQGISNDDPDIVKGRAGSPYAVKDYYNVNPDLAENPEKRLEEFKDLIARTHEAGLKLLIDIVPNHVARNYEGKTNPNGIVDFGAADDTTVVFKKDNNFYYNPGTSFSVPQWENGYVPLGGTDHYLTDGKFKEEPSKWTGNGSRLAQPNQNDWYETVKVNYGIDPEGNKHFDSLPDSYAQKHFSEHYEFWQDKEVPSSWKKFSDIALYWLDMGVDGFRFDMAEMVPVEFWSYMNSAIKMKNDKAFLLAEVYQPALYRDYLRKGKMDYLYDKVELYDSLKHVMQGHGWTDHIPVVQEGLKDIEHQMLHFLENHDEQRIASPEFAGDAKKGMPAMVVSATISTSPTMLYFGQEVGEPGAENAGFGKPSRTSIFDYVGVPHLQRWANNGLYDGGQSTEEEKLLRDFYSRLLNFTVGSTALMGHYEEIHFYNKDHTQGYDHRVLSYLRWSEDQKLIVIANFDAHKTYSFDLKLPAGIVEKWGLKQSNYTLEDALYNERRTNLKLIEGIGHISVELNPLESLIFELK